MDVANVFVTLGVTAHVAGCQWRSAALGRRPDRSPMPGCCEWDLSDHVLFQMLDNPKDGAVDTVSLRLLNLETGIERLRDTGIAVGNPPPISGFDTLRIATLTVPDGNTLNLLEEE